MKWEIFHRTHFDYAAPVRESSNELRLQPLSNEQQTVDSFLVKVLPTTRLRHYHDFYSNCVHHFELIEPHRTLTIESQLGVTTHALPTLPRDAILLLGLSGRGDKDINTVIAALGIEP